MKRAILLSLSIAMFAVGCSKNGDVKEFVKENDALVSEINKSTTADAAQKVFESHREALKTKLDSIKDARGFQVSQESQDALAKSLVAGATAICSLQIKAIGNPADEPKYKSLCDSYSNLMKL
jgi:PBP1b-binding outer membrane lipoprotein LpoB